MIIGAWLYDNGQSNEGAAFVYYGNENTCLRSTVQQYKPASSSVVYSGGNTGTIGQVKLNLYAKSPFGRADGKLVYEAKENGVPFSGNIITHSTSSTGSGSLADLGITGIDLNENISGLLASKEYKWRARVQYSLVNNPYQKFVPWKYYTNFVPLTFGCFKPRESVKTLSLSTIIEGFYDGSTMVSDTATVQLRNAFAPFNLVEQNKTILNTNGLGYVNFFTASDATAYYLVFKHRNSIETWSGLGQAFSGGLLTYDFTTSQNKAFGNNLKLKGTKWTIFSGDVNQDGVVDVADLVLIDVDNLSFVTGYTSTDLNGDNIVDVADLVIADVNNLNFVSKVTPTFLSRPERNAMINIHEQ